MKCLLVVSKFTNTRYLEGTVYNKSYLGYGIKTDHSKLSLLKSIKNPFLRPKSLSILHSLTEKMTPTKHGSK